jgi:tripartite-type tricarboxylate transporter receptor subunit TctC
MRSIVRSFITFTIACSFVWSQAIAQEYPSRPIRLIVPYPAGGPTDILGRITAQRLQAALGQPVVVENRAGGVTMIGADAVAKAPPDGHTLLMATSIPLINTVVFKKTPYKAADFALVAGIARTPNVLPGADVLRFGDDSGSACSRGPAARHCHHERRALAHGA